MQKSEPAMHVTGKLSLQKKWNLSCKANSSRIDLSMGTFHLVVTVHRFVVRVSTLDRLGFHSPLPWVSWIDQKSFCIHQQNGMKISPVWQQLLWDQQLSNPVSFTVTRFIERLGFRWKRVKDYSVFLCGSNFNRVLKQRVLWAYKKKMIISFGLFTCGEVGQATLRANLSLTKEAVSLSWGGGLKEPSFHQ